jgi:hypothetical protein
MHLCHRNVEVHTLINVTGMNLKEMTFLLLFFIFKTPYGEPIFDRVASFQW